MNVINLIKPEESTVSVKKVIFSDGEPHIWIEGLDHKEDVSVICRIANPDDLYVLMQVGNILNRHGLEWDLCIHYLMGARMDRVMSFQEAFSLEIVAQIINQLNAREVVIVEPHSDRALSLIKCSRPHYLSIIKEAEMAICYPDNGAAKRYGEQDWLYPHVIYCSKVRNPETGELGGFRIERTTDNSTTPLNSDYNGTILVTDDLCDRGGTFIGVWKLLKRSFPKATLCIQVTHMVNSAGIDNLAAHYDKVCFTDSYKDWEKERTLPANCTMIKIVS